MQGKTINRRLLSIRREVEAAFGKAEPPEADQVVKSRYPEPLQIRDYFAGKRWWELSLKDFRENYVGDESACLSFMAPAGIKYYLPAYLLMATESYYEGDILTQMLSWSMQGYVKYDSHYELSSLSLPQKNAVASVMSFIWEAYDDEDAQAVLEIIAEYWQISPKTE
ncbi:DUF6714 family protein [Pseudomonas sp. MWU13-3659]|uniref:DUF6714 family protein n=1 Tax=Pseudomonas sp. MWU13-3659 TaxID=2986964 RepID=UPI0020752060|nr:DUF6714 family protein [Pseudomonas sp. MWU13-3659]